MKKILLLCVLALYTITGVQAQMAPASVCTSPASYNYDEEVTWYFDLDGNSLVTPGQDLYFWSWEPQGLPAGPALMTHEKDMLWSLTFTPTVLYGVSVADIVAQGNGAFWGKIIDGPVDGVANEVTGTIPFALKEQLRLGSQCSCVGVPSPGDNVFLVNFGDVIASPDTNGNYWTNVENKDVGYFLTDTADGDRYDISATGSFITYTNPSGFTTPDPNLLGDLAIPLATDSYLYLTTGTGIVNISCLDPDRMYRLSLFGSRNAAGTRETEFTVIGAGQDVGVLQTSGTGISSDGNNNYNDDTFFVVDAFPDATGQIEIQVENFSGTFAYFNMMMVEEIANPNSNPITGVTIDTSNLSATGPSQLSVNYMPSDTNQIGVNWSVSDESIAIIDQDGNLKPKMEGTVTVTATSTFDSNISDSVSVTFSNLITDLYLSGTATEAGSDLASDAQQMRRITNPEGTITNEFEMYTSMQDTGTFTFFTATDGSGTEFGGDGSGNLIEDANSDIATPGSGWKYIHVDLNTMTYIVTAMYGWNVISHMIPKEAGQEDWWGGAESLPNYQGNGVWSGIVDFSETTSATDQPRFYIELAGTGRAVKQISGTQNELVFADEAQGVSYTDIFNFNGEYTITVDMQNFTYDISNNCSSIDDKKISILGSSVAKGFGASISTIDTTQYMGYAHRYDLLLRDRFTNNLGGDWEFSNLSIGGNDTNDVLDRYDFHVTTDCSKYVVIGLSLANEGVFSTGQVAFDQFVANMTTLIQQTENDGKIPVVVGNYANGGYGDVQYDFIKDMNLLIHDWDVASVNVMGTIDDGTGKWVSGYSSDGGHPNDAGYTEMMYAFVPSLFDAMDAGKPQPVLVNNTFVTLGNQVGRTLKVIPEEQVHSYTVSVDFKTNSNGEIMMVANDSQSGNLTIDATTGTIVYNSPLTGQITGTDVVNDDAWHTVTLSHFYARGETLLYVDGTEQGSLSENFVLEETSINSISAPTVVDYRNLFFYRSGMNADEVSAMTSGSLLKSSLEVYAPLDGQNTTSYAELENIAQSLNTVVEETFTLGINDFILDGDNFKVVPNPVTEYSELHFSLLKASDVEITIFNLNGQVVSTYANKNTVSGDRKISLLDATQQPLDQGIYICKLETTFGSKAIKLIVK